MNTLVTEVVQYYPDTVKVYDAQRPAVWALFESTWQGVRLLEYHNATFAWLNQAHQLAALAV